LLCVCPVFISIPTHVFTREGDDAILPCALDSPVFDWKKKQQEVFFYEKGKHYNNGKRGQDLQFVGRVHLLPGGLQAGDASVILSSVTQADGGVYSCYFPRRNLTRWIRLTVGNRPFYLFRARPRSHSPKNQEGG
uniref:Ig-like domain-containing protein n=1 Tax=Gadus morhua TaxID=8049 RepID=A0A8C5FXM9_GADMO